ncbi:short-chain dehydrogenase [Phlyctema vagabunda]|uniref:Short-chain dehydrogenase n=1 Tax=Phlyctema vagabunda TaxID=108571 RepID=A0ABR4PPG8_9HELO
MGTATPTITEKNRTDLKGKVYVVARSAIKAQAAIDSMKAKSPNFEGVLVYVKLDLSDLTTIKTSDNEFLSKEARLEVHGNNVGVLFLLAGSKSVQSYELQLGVKCVGSFLLAKLLTPSIIETTKVTE